MQGGYDDGAAHLIAFATTEDVLIVLWRSDQSGNYLGHRIISMRDVSSTPSQTCPLPALGT